MSIANREPITQRCPACDGSGTADRMVRFGATADAYDCTLCDGDGHVTERIASAHESRRHRREGRHDG